MNRPGFARLWGVSGFVVLLGRREDVGFFIFFVIFVAIMAQLYEKGNLYLRPTLTCTHAATQAGQALSWWVRAWLVMLTKNNQGLLAERFES